MYNSYFGFLESPFENRLDQKFLFLSEDHSEVLAALLYFIKEEKGFALVCGDVGTGKTMLINGFLDRLPQSVQPLIISNPNVLYLDLIRYLAKTLEVEAANQSVLELTDEVKKALVEARSQGKVFVLIVDEAHLLSDASLEDIRLLSNIETRDHKLLQILLVGQYELSHKLDRPEMRQLRQRINISRFLSPLNPQETVQYIDHRLGKVGADFASCFEANCRSQIYRMTEGVPRKINQLCDSALLICMTEGQRKVNRQVLKKAGEALLTDLVFTPKSAQRQGSGLGRARKFWLPAAAGLGLFFLGLGAQTGWLRLPPWSGSLAPGVVASVPEAKALPEPTPAAQEPEGLKPPREEAGALRPALPAPLKEAAAPGPASPPGPVASPPQTGREAPTPGQVPEAPGPKPAGPAPTPGVARESGAKPAEIPEPARAAPELPRTPDQLAGAPGNLVSLPVAPASPPAGRGAPPPPGEGLTAAGEPSAPEPDPGAPVPAQIVIKEGDCLTRIAAKWYPENVELGMEAIILANLKNSKEDLLHPGQVLFLPRLKAATRTIQLRDRLFYALYDRFRSFAQLQEVMPWLNHTKVRYLILNSIDSAGVTNHHVILGGYEREKDLEKALKSLERKSG